MPICQMIRVESTSLRHRGAGVSCLSEREVVLTQRRTRDRLSTRLARGSAGADPSRESANWARYRETSGDGATNGQVQRHAPLSDAAAGVNSRRATSVAGTKPPEITAVVAKQLPYNELKVAAGAARSGAHRQGWRPAALLVDVGMTTELDRSAERCRGERSAPLDTRWFRSPAWSPGRALARPAPRQPRLLAIRDSRPRNTVIVVELTKTRSDADYVRTSARRGVHAARVQPEPRPPCAQSRSLTGIPHWRKAIAIPRRACDNR